MPRKEDIERFKEVLNSLGSEPEIRAAKSELIEEVAPPEEGLPADINELLGTFGEPLEAEPEAVEQAPPLEEEAPSLDEEAPSLPEEAPSLHAEAPSLEASAEGLDFESLFGEQNEPPTIEDLENVAQQRPREAKRSRDSKRERAGRAKPEQPAEEEALGEGKMPAKEETPPEAATLAGGEALTEVEALAEGAAPAEAAAPAAPEEIPATDEFPLELQADIDQMEVLPAEEAAAAPPEQAPPEQAPESEEPQEEPQFEGIELPSLDELQEAPAATPAGEQPSPPAEQPVPAAHRPPSPIEDFPTLESFDLGETETAKEPQAFGQQEQEPIAPAEESLSGGGMESLGGSELGELDMNEFDIPEAAEPLGLTSAKPEPRMGQRAPEQRAQRAGQRKGQQAREAPAAGRLAEKARAGLRGAAKRAAQRIAPIAGRLAPIAGRLAPGRAGRLEELEPAVTLGAEGAVVDLTAQQFDDLKKSLSSLPRNLKIAVQDVIAAGRGSAAQLASLVSLLVQGASAQEIAALAGRITGKSIRIPAGYEKKTGAVFEAERRTFAYAFRENIFPVLRLFVLSSLAVGLFAFLGYRFVYRPLYAYANYSRGYEHISAERYSLANERFSRAVGVWPRRNWFYRYAEAFAGKRQFPLAQEKYDQLLLRYPGDRKGILDYARMESISLMNYEKADTLLQKLLDKNLHDYDALLAVGDNNLEWAERDPLRFEEARRSYAALIQTYGQRDALLFKMLRYFIRAKKTDEVERLRAYYAERPQVRVEPEAFAELGGYLIDVNRLDYVPDVLFRAMRVRADLPEIHYSLARYYKILNDTAEEHKALEQGVLPLLKGSATLTKKRMTIEIDTHTRLGELHYRQEAYLDAGRELATAVRLVERYQKMGLIGSGRIFGQPYVDLGDLRYYIEGDLPAALANYQKAVANEYADPLLDYKMGYIRYAGGEYEAALGSFLAAEDALAAKAAPAADGSLGSSRPPANLLFSIGNAFYQRADYFAAQGYFLRLLDSLATRRAAIGVLQPEQKPEHRALLEALVKADNNLGVVMVRLAERTGDRRKKSQALVSLASASETADVLSRVPETLARSEAKNLPFLNMRGVLYPVSGFEPQIYRMIPKDFEAMLF